MKRKQYLFFIIILLIIFIIVIVSVRSMQQQEGLSSYDICFSINVHEKFDFLSKQLENIREYVDCNYCVVLNCNKYMYDECTNNRSKLPDNIFINDKVIEKKTFHGSLTEGMYENMVYALNHMTFDYFIIMSSRNMFSNKMTLHDVETLHPLYELNDNGMKKIQVEQDSTIEKVKTTNTGWHWGSFLETKLAKEVVDNKSNLYGSAHEGLMFTFIACNKIVSYLKQKEETRMNLFQSNSPVEEFGLQTLAVMLNEPFYYIGNGCCSNDKPPTNIPESTYKKFMHKVNRD